MTHARAQKGVAAASSGVADPVSPDRRHFLEQTAVLISATPWSLAGYGQRLLQFCAPIPYSTA